MIKNRYYRKFTSSCFIETNILELCQNLNRHCWMLWRFSRPYELDIVRVVYVLPMSKRRKLFPRNVSSKNMNPLIFKIPCYKLFLDLGDKMFDIHKLIQYKCLHLLNTIYAKLSEYVLNNIVAKIETYLWFRMCKITFLHVLSKKYLWTKNSFAAPVKTKGESISKINRFTKLHDQTYSIISAQYIKNHLITIWPILIFERVHFIKCMKLYRWMFIEGTFRFRYIACNSMVRLYLNKIRPQ